MQWLDFVNKLLTYWYSYFLPTWSAFLSVCSNSVFFLLIFLHNCCHLVSPVCILTYSSVYLLLFLLLLFWHYSQMRTFPSLMNFSQSALYTYFDISCRFVILHLFISDCTKFHHLFLVLLLVDFPEDYC